MTLEDILNELEALKDFVNDQQKPRLENLKDAVATLCAVKEPGTVSVVEPVETKREAPQEVSKVESVVEKKRAYKRKTK